MLFALFPINTSALADPELMARVAVAADEAGIESVFTGEHIVVPDPMAPPSHVPPETVLVHPSTALAFCAAVARIRRRIRRVQRDQRIPEARAAAATHPRRWHERGRVPARRRTRQRMDRRWWHARRCA